jgi:aspartyl/glutamyl-tRNA(Asn/Gln) amidotransferase C subunit
MSLSRRQLQALQRLAFLDVDDAACRALQADLDTVVSWVAALPECASAEDETRQGHDCRLRPDEVRASPSVETMLCNAPRRQDGFVRVPLFVERET